MTRASVDRDATALYPELRRLISLRGLGGWQFMVRRQDGGIVDLVGGLRVWPQAWTDVLVIAGIDDAKAHRTDPDGGQVWVREGGLADVIDDLTELPAPGEPGAPRLVGGHAPSLWVPSGDAMSGRSPQ